MIIKIKETGAITEVELFPIQNDWEHGPDIFSTVAFQLPIKYPAANDDADATMTEAEFDKEIGWWKAEVDRYNSHNSNNWFMECCDDPETEWAKCPEYDFYYDEVR